MGTDLRGLVCEMEALCKRIRVKLDEEQPKLFDAPAKENPVTGAQVDAQWESARTFANAHGQKWRTTMGPPRRELILRTLRTYPGIWLRDVVVGFELLTREWSPSIREAKFVPEFIFRPGNVDKHLEAALRAASRKMTTPPAPPPPVDVLARAADAQSLGQSGSFGRVGS